MKYFKQVFDVSNFEHAKNVVLTNDPSNPFKYEQETNFLVNTILKNLNITNNCRVLDFGCGVGRISKELIKRTNCFIFGIDISESMLDLASKNIYNSNKFLGSDKFPYDESVDIALSCFALQHAENPIDEIKKIYSCLVEHGIFILVNEKKRLVPVGADKNNYVIWQDDKINIHKEVENYFKEFKKIKYLKTDVDVIFYEKLTVAQ